MKNFSPLFFFVLFFFLAVHLPAQVLPVRVTSSSKVFSIPFEIRPDLSADPIKEVELMVSDDNGAGWRSVEKRPVTAKRFDFQAEKDTEYWFCFRTITLSGTVRQTGTGPQLRVLVDTAPREPAPKTMTSVPPNPIRATDSDTVTKKQAENLIGSERDSYGTLLPPKPVRMKKENAPVPSIEKKETDNSAVEKEVKPQSGGKSSLPLLTAPDGSIAQAASPKAAPVQEQSESDVMVLKLLAEMGPFYDEMLKDIKPVPQREPQTFSAMPSPVLSSAVPNEKVASNAAAGTAVIKKLPGVEQTVQAGSIAGISLNRQGQQPQLVVKWNTGGESWKGAQADILRSFNAKGQEPYFPIAINLENAGQYWWFLSSDDLKPFFIRIRLRSAAGGILTDTTSMPIQISPNLLTPQ